MLPAESKAQRWLFLVSAVYEGETSTTPDPNLDLDQLARIEAELLERVRIARTRYEQAKGEATRLYSLQLELSLDLPDGRLAALQTARIESQALQVYSAALREFSDFILARKLPKDPSSK